MGIESGASFSPEPAMGSHGAISSPEVRNYPPKQSRRVRPGVPFHITPILDPDRAVALHFLGGWDALGEIDDAVHIRLQGTKVRGEVYFMHIGNSIEEQIGTPIHFIGQARPLYAIDLYFEGLTEDQLEGDKLEFTASLDGKTLSVQRAIGMEDFELSSWIDQKTGEDGHIAAIPEDLPRIEYTLILKD